MALAVTPSNEIRSLVRSTPNWAGATTPMTDFAVPAASATAAPDGAEYPALDIAAPFRCYQLAACMTAACGTTSGTGVLPAAAAAANETVWPAEVFAVPSVHVLPYVLDPSADRTYPIAVDAPVVPELPLVNGLPGVSVPDPAISKVSTRSPAGGALARAGAALEVTNANDCVHREEADPSSVSRIVV